MFAVLIISLTAWHSSIVMYVFMLEHKILTSLLLMLQVTTLAIATANR